MKTPFDFGATLRELRKQKGCTQKRMAEALHLSETTISKYESNTAVPPFETVMAIATWFNVSIDTLAGKGHPSTVSLCGLTDKQSGIVRDLVKAYGEKNSMPSGKMSAKDYELLGKIVESMQEKRLP